MAQRPQDRVDLYLAPVVLGLDAELDALAALSPEELGREVALRTNQEPRNVEQRRDLLLQAVAHFVDTHGWKLAWNERGLEIRHEEHRVVLGVPASVWAYVEEAD